MIFTMNDKINGHTLRTERAKKMWENWAYLYYIEGMKLQEIAQKYTRMYGGKFGRKYTPQYMYMKISSVKDEVIARYKRDNVTS